MMATVLRRPNPIMLQLDRANPFEALILNEIERRSASRQAEWLRSLLVQGFQCECRALQAIEAVAAASVEPSVTIDAAAPRPALTVVNDALAGGPPATPPDGAPDASEAPTPFAALRKVIG